LFRSLLLGGLLAAAAALTAGGLAGAGTLEAMLDGALQPSAAPAILGPIEESGRAGWDCKPEHAAAASRWQDAELPAP